MDTIKKIGRQKGCIPWNKGKTGIYSQETIEKIRIGATGRKQSKETIEKRVAKLIGHKSYLPKGFIPWNKGTKGKSASYWTGKKRPNMTGENHPLWVFGNYKKDNTRNDSAYQNWKKNVHKRDNYKCVINNSDCCGNIIVHHILPWRDYPELRYEINNGITLCLAHHPRKRAEEKRLAPTFQELVSVSI